MASTGPELRYLTQLCVISITHLSDQIVENTR